MEDMPEVGELVIVRVRKILPYGAFCDLEEYTGKEAFVHISEVTSRWVKNIHEFVSVGKMNVARVYRLKPEKNQIDISFKRVSDGEKRRKLNEVKRMRRADKLFEIVSKNAKISEDKETEYYNSLIDEYGDLYLALEEISEKGAEAIKDLKFPKKFTDCLVELAQKSIKKPKAHLRGELSLTVYESDGTEIVKKILSKLKLPKEVEASLIYIGAPTYKLDLTANDYKTGEKALEDLLSDIKKRLGKADHTLVFERVKKEK